MLCFIEDLRKLPNRKKKAHRFGVPMIRREPKNHKDDCYFCCCVTNIEIKRFILYPNLSSALRPLLQGPDIPVPQPTEILEYASNNSSDSGGDNKEFQCDIESQSAQLFTPSELSDEIRDLGLFKGKAELLDS
jgi:hypothetical protein